MTKRRFVGLNICHALIARILFASHSLLAIFQLFRDSDSPEKYYYLTIIIAPVGLFLEAAVTILLRHGDEYKWFCPSIFIFLCGSVPPIWLLEVAETNRALNYPNYTFVKSIEELHGLLDGAQPINLQLALLVILVVGRWLLPKGSLSRDELSQLLLAYLAISSDIVELFNLFSHQQVRRSLELTVILLAMWSVSLIQFPMVLTTVKGQKSRYCWPSARQLLQRANLPHLPASRVESNGSNCSPGEDKRIGSTKSSRPRGTSKRKSVVIERIADLSVWGILSTVALQDGPFLCFRLYMIVWKNIHSYTLYFFVAKNSSQLCRSTGYW